MALFHVIGIDKPNSKALRDANLAAHREFIGALGERMKIGGPLLADDSDEMIGSLFVIEADDRAALNALLAEEPFYKSGLFAAVHAHRFRGRVLAPI